MQIVAAPVLGIIFNLLLQCVEANLTLDFRVTKISASHQPANCNVANTTYAHGETFKLDCKTQCVCENGRHACSSLCPKEQLPAPEDTISCRSPRLVEVPGHCCKMWLCENPTADVYATCHNSSTSPWTPCSRMCGLGISTRVTTTTAGCNQLSNLRLCENRKCEVQQYYTDNRRKQHEGHEQKEERVAKNKHKYLMKTKQLKYKLRRQNRLQKYQQQVHGTPLEYEHRIRKGHECRSLQRLGPARIRLGQCVSKKLYRPKICGRCHQNTKCCVPSVSTTIQVELLCPLNAMDPISFVQQQLKTEQQLQRQRQRQQHIRILYPKESTSSSSPSMKSLWDTHSLDAIDQEYLQSHQIQIANKFIAVEWILKCECTKNDNCQRTVNVTTAAASDNSHRNVESSNSDINNHKYHDYDDNENVETDNNFGNNKNMQHINYFKLNHNNGNKNSNYENNEWKNSIMYNDYKQQLAERAAAAAAKIDKIPDDSKNVDERDDVNKRVYRNEDNKDNGSDININSYYNNNNRNIHNKHGFDHKKQTMDYVENNKKISNSNKSDNMVYNENIVGNNDEDENDDDDDEQIEHENVKENEWSNSLSSAFLSVPSLSSSSSSNADDDELATSSDEVQPDIIPYPPPPFSANKHTTSKNNKNNYNNINNNNRNNTNGSNNKNTETNWIKDTLKVEQHSKQNKQQQQQVQYEQQQQQQQKQLYEHWLLQQYNNNNNNKPYQTDRHAT